MRRREPFKLGTNLALPCRDDRRSSLHDVRMTTPSVAGNARHHWHVRRGNLRAAVRRRRHDPSRVDNLISAHVFVGVLLIPFVLVKIGSTGYRFFRYYSGRTGVRGEGTATDHPPAARPGRHGHDRRRPGDRDRRGPGPRIGLARRSRTRRASSSGSAPWPCTSSATRWRRRGSRSPTGAEDGRRQAPGATARLALLAATVGVGIPLAIASLGWAHHWHRRRAIDRRRRSDRCRSVRPLRFGSANRLSDRPTMIAAIASVELTPKHVCSSAMTLFIVRSASRSSCARRTEAS